MRADGVGQRGEGRVILGRVLIKVLSSESVEIDRPLGVGGRRRHDEKLVGLTDLEKKRKKKKKGNFDREGCWEG